MAPLTPAWHAWSFSAFHAFPCFLFGYFEGGMRSAACSSIPVRNNPCISWDINSSSAHTMTRSALASYQNHPLGPWVRSNHVGGSARAQREFGRIMTEHPVYCRTLLNQKCTSYIQPNPGLGKQHDIRNTSCPPPKIVEFF